jgi:hypothetical protein
MIAKAIERAGDGLIKIRSIEASKEVTFNRWMTLTVDCCDSCWETGSNVCPWWLCREAR